MQGSGQCGGGCAVSPPRRHRVQQEEPPAQGREQLPLCGVQAGQGRLSPLQIVSSGLKKDKVVLHFQQMTVARS
jgi:hypothetical protein